ncbi:12012_t:CDS:2 [Funneliformis mosseae]|uniref:12012_t:CDS:1 n=1 Tax=Funneliformis mosseae TaxID=27381 RepID=A0A9N9DJG7_FUNMO|nr:12012_t:CDS:2 [Funneliformis mosseae]
MPNMVESSSWIVVHQSTFRSVAFIFIGLIQDTCIKPESSRTYHLSSPSKEHNMNITLQRTQLGKVSVMLLMSFKVQYHVSERNFQPIGNTLEGVWIGCLIDIFIIEAPKVSEYKACARMLRE